MLKLKILFILFSVIFFSGFLYGSWTVYSAKMGGSDLSDQFAEIELDKTVAYLPCPAGYYPPGGKECEDGMTIAVETSLKENVTGEIFYKYEVSGGRVIGEGKDVIWDLNSLSPGTYTISVIIETKDGNVLGKSKTGYITVENCSCGGDCFCSSSFEIGSPDLASDDATVKRGDKIVFRVTLAGTDENTEFYWTISGGEIIYENPAKSLIRIKVNSEKSEKELKVSVKVKNYDTCQVCKDEASISVKILDE